MEEIQNQLERLIEDIEGDEKIPRVDIISSLYKLKEEIEDYNLRREEGGNLEWEDLDGPN